MTELQLPSNEYDLVFSNWLLMYLSDEECARLAASLLSWVSLAMSCATDSCTAGVRPLL